MKAKISNGGPDRRPLMSLQRVADEFDVSVSTIRRLIKGGELRAVRVRQQLRIEPEEAERYRNCHRT